jgi:hypothetical protein
MSVKSKCVAGAVEHTPPRERTKETESAPSGTGCVALRESATPTAEEPSVARVVVPKSIPPTKKRAVRADGKAVLQAPLAMIVAVPAPVHPKLASASAVSHADADRAAPPLSPEA